MPNMDPLKQIMPTQEAKIRATNFDEVALGYSLEAARKEAERCLNCKTKPCVNGCPVHIDIPSFIMKLKENDLDGAYEIIAKSSSLPAICGRVCPQESQCEALCTRGKGNIKGVKSEAVAIGRLERFVADYHNSKNLKSSLSTPKNGHKVAIIGSGPSGLACASDLVKDGFEVTIFEALHLAGGVLSYGIPEFRLPKSIVKQEIDNLSNLGVKIVKDVVIGKTLTIDELFLEGFEAIFIGSGAGLPKFMNIPGEGLNGVLSANEFLTRTNLMKAYLDNADTPIKKGGKVIVVGGGNVAMDAARVAKRLGSEVKIVYRRTKDELPARKEEVEHALEEGIEFYFLTNPIKINGDENNNVKSLTCLSMELGEPDASLRRRPIEIKGSEHDIEANQVIMALGTSPNPLLKMTTDGLETNKWGGIIVNEETNETSLENIYAGGDAVTGAATVILAMGAGKKAAKAIKEKLNKKEG